MDTLVKSSFCAKPQSAGFKVTSQAPLRSENPSLQLMMASLVHSRTLGCGQTLHEFPVEEPIQKPSERHAQLELTYWRDMNQESKSWGPRHTCPRRRSSQRRKTEISSPST